MYTVAFFIKRKPGMSRNAFLKYYEQRHGPLMVEIAGKRGLVAYEHFPVEPSTGALGDEPKYDGFSVYDFETKAQAEACWALPEVLADGHAFIAMDEMVELIVTRRLVFSNPQSRTEQKQ